MPSERVEKPSYFTKNKFTFMNLSQGNRVIRFLDPIAPGYQTHYLPKQRVTVHCIGKDCPICETNKRIVFENPKEFRKDENFIGTVEKYLVNVLDKSMVKTCPNPDCGMDNYSIEGQFAPACAKCDTIITTVEPRSANKVKLLMYGKDLSKTLDAIEKATKDQYPELDSWTKFDIVITSTGKGKEITRVAMAKPDAREVVSEELMGNKSVLSTILIELTRDEMIQAVRGVSLKDLFAARNATETVTKLEDAVSQETKDLVDGLMNG
jgi:hypothetical protein